MTLCIKGKYPSSNWYDMIGDPTIADAILDRIIHTAHTIELYGESMRKLKSKKVTFIYNLMQANGINTVLDEDDMDYALTLMSEEDLGETASDRKKRQDTCYATQGRT